MMQHGHLTSLQLEIMNQCTMQFVQPSALHGSSSGWCTIVRHKGHRSLSRIRGLLELATICSSCKKTDVRVRGAIAHMAARILAELLWAGLPAVGDALCGGFG